MKIAVIPARGGSKRIPRKNMREFLGKPMLVWSIEEAIKSELFDYVIVSTDDAEIADLGRASGAEVPFVRPDELADDHTPTIPVIAHATKWCQDNFQEEITGVCCIYPSPFVRSDDLVTGLKLLQEGFSYTFVATEFPVPIFHAFSAEKEEGIQMLFPEHFNTRTQDLKTMFYDAGQFYWGTPESWLEGKPIFGSYSQFIEIPKWRVYDIDTLDDWKRAELASGFLTEVQ